jgi:hypothetical protein
LEFGKIKKWVRKFVNGVALGQGAVQVPGPAGQGVPSGCTAGKILIKNSNGDYDTEWAEIQRITNAEIQSIINKL